MTTYLFSGLRQANTIAIFRKALYVFLAYEILLYSFWFKELFGEHSLIYQRSVPLSSIKDLASLLSHYNNSVVNALSIFMAALIVMAGLLGRQSMISNLLLWLIFLNIHTYLYPTLTAGDWLLNQLLFFNLFLFAKPVKHPVLKDLQFALHNSALTGMKIQVCLVYLIASYYKLSDVDWMHGEAVYQSLQVNAYTLPWLKSLPYPVYVLMDYFTLVYQSLFVLLIWIRPLKKYVLAIGVLQHLFIAFGIGLFGFGSIMIISYIIFLDLEKKS